MIHLFLLKENKRALIHYLSTPKQWLMMMKGFNVEIKMIQLS